MVLYLVGWITGILTEMFSVTLRRPLDDREFQ